MVLQNDFSIILQHLFYLLKKTQKKDIKIDHQKLNVFQWSPLKTIFTLIYNIFFLFDEDVKNAAQHYSF